MNWGFVALYVTCRLSPNFVSARSAMWLSATAMSFLNVPLFFLAPEMVSNVFDAGQGIGVIQAMLSMPLWFGPYPIFLIPTLALVCLLAPLAPIPFLGFDRLHRWTIHWMHGQLSKRENCAIEGTGYLSLPAGLSACGPQPKRLRHAVTSACG